MIDAWGAWLFPTALAAGLVALVCLVFERAARLDARPGAALLVVALLQFVVPPFLRVPLTGIREVAGTGIGSEAAATVAAVASSAGGAWLVLVVAAQAVGIVVGLAMLSFSMVTVRRNVRAAERVLSGPVLRELEGVAVRLGSRMPRLYVTSGFGPAAVGVFVPAVALPRSLLERLTSEELRQVLLHEAAHVLRRDPLTACVRWFVLSAWWFHPLAWLVAHRHRTVTEQACDDLALDHAPDDPAGYCRTLVKCARMSTGTPPAVPAMRGSSMERRIRRVLDGGPRSRRRPALERAVLAAALLTLPLGVVPSKSHDESLPRAERSVPEAGTDGAGTAALSAPIDESTEEVSRRVRRKVDVIVR